LLQAAAVQVSRADQMRTKRLVEVVLADIALVLYLLLIIPL
jgi:lipopolysaccharide/colanic/teichoic acid biosynthesis glycosyltransferase